MGAGHAHGHDATRAFAWVTLINLAYTVLEAGYGFATNSLALLSDALHNFGDVLGLGLAWGASVIAQRPPTERHTYGWRRATLLSPLANALLLVGFSGALAWEAIRRFDAPPQVPGLPVMVVAAIGIVINLGGAWLMRGGHAHDLNRRGAFLHLIADAAVSLAAVLAGAGIWALGWAWLDPATALLVAVVVAVGSFGLLRESFNAAMDAVPRGIDQQQCIGQRRQQGGAAPAIGVAFGRRALCNDCCAPRQAQAQHVAEVVQRVRKQCQRIGGEAITRFKRGVAQVDQGHPCKGAGGLVPVGVARAHPASAATLDQGADGLAAQDAQ